MYEPGKGDTIYGRRWNSNGWQLGTSREYAQQFLKVNFNIQLQVQFKNNASVPFSWQEVTPPRAYPQRATIHSKKWCAILAHTHAHTCAISAHQASYTHVEIAHVLLWHNCMCYTNTLCEVGAYPQSTNEFRTNECHYLINRSVHVITVFWEDEFNSCFTGCVR